MLNVIVGFHLYPHPETSVEREFHCSLSLWQGHHSNLPQIASSVGSPVFWVLKTTSFLGLPCSLISNGAHCPKSFWESAGEALWDSAFLELNFILLLYFIDNLPRHRIQCSKVWLLISSRGSIVERTNILWSLSLCVWVVSLLISFLLSGKVSPEI